VPTPQPSTLPQPTAPFSTPRPAGLGERVIHPISQPTTSKDIGSLMEKELSEDTFGSSTPNSTPSPVSTPSASPTQPAPASSLFASSQQPQAQEPETPAVSAAAPQFTQPTPPAAPFTPSQPASPPANDPADAPESTLSFEETPRQSGAIPNPFHQGPQPPAQQ
jgi:hypothetical protein